MMNARLAASLLALLLPVFAALPAAAAPAPHLEKTVLAGGCFWGMEAVFEKLRGVTNVVAGYSGGAKLTAHYEMVSTGTTGHAESVEITFDPARISYARLLDVYFSVAHDPTQLNHQGADEGPQYRSEIFFTDAAQKQVAEAKIRDLAARHVYAAPIVTKVEPLQAFYPAEAYHQHYADLHPDNGYIVAVDEPKLAALRDKFPQLLKH